MMHATIADAALDYHRRGWKPVPVSRQTKKPIGKGWQKRPFNPAQFNGNDQNVAVQLGEVSGGLADVGHRQQFGDRARAGISARDRCRVRPALKAGLA